MRTKHIQPFKLIILFGFLLLTSCNLQLPGSGDTGDRRGTPTASRPAAPANSDGAETILIPGGTFWMGSETTDAQAEADERPRHQVTLDSFYIYTHEVTNAMYDKCVEAGACLPIQKMKSGPTSHYDDAAYAEHPVTGVDWLMARDYCVWAGGRLPTEAEWELAARGADSLRYPWGEKEPACDTANMLGCRVPPDTLAVGSLANGNSPYKVWDMSGNVWEWANDWYDEDYYQLSPSSNPLGPYYGELKAARGGGLYSEPVQLRGAARVGASPQHAYDDIGFRCVPEAEALPETYYAPDEGHTWDDPDPLDGGGDHVADADEDVPDHFIGRSHITCPDAEGRIHVYIEEVRGYGPGEYSMTVSDAPFTCTFDEASGVLDCVGTAPAATEGRYFVVIFFPDGTHLGSMRAAPEDCPGPGGGLFSYGQGGATCPDAEGRIHIYAEASDSRSDNWGMTVEGTPFDCTYDAASEKLDCVGPLPSTPESIWVDVYLDGVLRAGARTSIPEDCGFTANVGPACHAGMAGIQVTYPEDIIGLTSASAAGAPLACIDLAPGRAFCGPLPGAPHSSIPYRVCFDDGSCFDLEMHISDCSEEESSGGPMEFVGYGCRDESQIYFVIDTHLDWLVPGAGSVSATSDPGLVGYTCSIDPAIPGRLYCSGPRPADARMLTVNIDKPDGSRESHSIDGWEGVVVDIPACSGEETSGGTWEIAGYGCHNESNIYFILDTHLTWLVPGAVYTYSASDGVSSYLCSLHPTITGRLYCSGPRPAAPGPLLVCLTIYHEETVCQSIDAYPGMVAAIPACDAEEEPPPPSTDSSCSGYDFNTCQMNNDHCRWVGAPPPGHCEPK